MTVSGIVVGKGENEEGKVKGVSLLFLCICSFLQSTHHWRHSRASLDNVNAYLPSTSRRPCNRAPSTLRRDAVTRRHRLLSLWGGGCLLRAKKTREQRHYTTEVDVFLFLKVRILVVAAVSTPLFRAVNFMFLFYNLAKSQTYFNFFVVVSPLNVCCFFPTSTMKTPLGHFKPSLLQIDHLFGHCLSQMR